MNEKEIIRKHFAKMGAIGGMSGRGKSKARSASDARKAALARWKNHRSRKKGKNL
jgi:hypothetical protein